MDDHAKTIRLFERAAQQRLAAAAFLFQHDFYLDATYLAGYAVECALKALVLRRTPRTRRGKMVAQLTEVGAKGHNVEYLKEQLKRQLGGRKRKDRDVLGSIADALRTATFWSTSLRYQVGVLPFDEARDFMRAARHIVDWCRRS